MMMIRFVYKKNDNSYAIQFKESTTKTKNVLLKKIIMNSFQIILKEYLLQQQLDLLMSRRIQQRSQEIKSKEAKKKLQDKEIDKALNPSKYKAVRPGSGVRNGSGGGGYKPSEAAQARRTVKTRSG